MPADVPARGTNLANRGSHRGAYRGAHRRLLRYIGRMSRDESPWLAWSRRHSCFSELREKGRTQPAFPNELVKLSPVLHQAETK